MELIIMKIPKQILIVSVVFILLISLVFATDQGFKIRDLTLIQDEYNQRTLKNGETYDEFITPDSKIEFEIELENIYKKDINIKDISIIIKIENITKGKTIIEDEDKFNLNHKKTKLKSLKLEIPDDVEEVKKRVNINITGIDEDDNTLKINWNIFIDIEEEDHDIIIYNTKLNQTTIDCQGKAELITWISNEGNYDEDKVAIEFINKDLGLFKRFDSIDIEEEEKYTKRIVLDLRNIEKTGTFPIEIKSYYKDDHLDDIETVNIKTIACRQQIQPEKENITEDKEEVIISPSEPTKLPSKEPQKNDSNLILIGFTIAFISLLILILIILIILIKK
jgi:hypothetical protein